MRRITKREMIYFAIGQLGWSILSGIITNLLVNFYLPDASDVSAAGSSLKYFIYSGTVLFGLTVIGLITACGRVFDAVTDPWIASLSDRCSSKQGRRIPFLKYSSLPFAVVTVLVFCAPVGHVSAFNVVWLAITLVAFYLCMTAYCTPYNALLPVLGKNQKDRMDLSTYISITYILGTGIAFSGKMIWDFIHEQTGMNYYLCARLVLIVLALIALICMLVPAFTIKENEFVDHNEAKIVNEAAFKSLVKTFKNKQFCLFVVSDVLYWIGITIFNTGFIYYVENLLKLNCYMLLFILMTFVTFILYIPVNKLTLKFGKKKMTIAGFILFAIAFLFSAFAGKVSFIPNIVYGVIICILVGVPLAILGVIPQAIVADIAQADSIKTNENHDGMFYAARTFAFKLGQGIAMIIFTSLAVIGEYTDSFGNKLNNGKGYRIGLIVALVMSLLAGLVLIFYKEKDVMDVIDNASKDKNTKEVVD